MREREREWRNTCTSKGEKEGLKEGGGGTCIMVRGMERDSKWWKDGKMREGWKEEGKK